MTGSEPGNCLSSDISTKLVETKPRTRNLSQSHPRWWIRSRNSTDSRDHPVFLLTPKIKFSLSFGDPPKFGLVFQRTLGTISNLKQVPFPWVVSKFSSPYSPNLDIKPFKWDRHHFYCRIRPVLRFFGRFPSVRPPPYSLIYILTHLSIVNDLLFEGTPSSEWWKTIPTRSRVWKSKTRSVKN